MKDKKTCPLCESWIKDINYKDIETLKNYTTKFNKIVPRYYSWTCLKHQKKIAKAIKQARYMSLLPYVLDLK